MAIELEHSFAVPVPPEQAWDVLLDVARVAPCMPGATVDSVDGDVVTGKIKVKVGPIAVTYAGQARFTERDPAGHVVKMKASGKETRGAGTASATVHARLEDTGGQTRVRVNTSLNVTGRPAQFGRGVLAEVGGKLIERFSANLAEQLAVSTVPGLPPHDAAEDPSPAETVPQDAQEAPLAMPIQMLNLPLRSYNGLKCEGIDTVGELVARTGDELLAIKNIGVRSVREIEDRLRDLGLALAGTPAGQAAATSNGSRPAAGEPAGTAAAGTAAAGTAAAGTGAAGTGAAGTGAAGTGLTDTGPGWGGEGFAAGAAGPVEDAAGRGDDSGDALDLFDVAAGPVLKRVLPALAAVFIVVVLGILLRRRGRSPAG